MTSLACSGTECSSTELLAVVMTEFVGVVWGVRAADVISLGLLKLES